MHIAMLASEYPPRWGGMASTLFHLCGYLGKKGHKVTVITRSGKGEAPPLEGVDVLKVRWLKLPMEFTRSYGRTAWKALEKLHAVNPVDVVHVHAPMISWSEKQFERCRSRVAPIVTTLHGSWLGERDGLVMAKRLKEPAAWANPNDIAILLTAKHYARFERAAMRGSDICYAISHDSRNDFRTRYDPPDDWKCPVIYTGIDTEMFHPWPQDDADSVKRAREIRERYDAGHADSILLLAVGRLAARKGYSNLLRGFKRVHAASPRCRLVIVGRGHLKKRLSLQAARDGISDAVHIESGMPFEDVAALYRSADLVVFPSFYEGLGLIPLESMSSGTPVVTVDHGPLPELVDDSVGALFTMGVEQSMVQTILNEISDRDSLKQKGIAGRKRVIDSFSLVQESEQVLELYGLISS